MAALYRRHASHATAAVTNTTASSVNIFAMPSRKLMSSSSTATSTMHRMQVTNDR
jgi:hypothetical protein